MLRYLTAGESHGQALVVILEGLPAGLHITVEEIQDEMARRRLGYGRGPRQRFEQDELTLIGGVRHGRTLGSPLAIEIKNSEWFRDDKWHEEMSPAPGATKDPLTKVRPGHADLAGMQKYGFTDARDVLERASARETAARVAAGAVAKKLLAELGTSVISHVIQLGTARAAAGRRPTVGELAKVDDSPVRCFDSDAELAMVEEVKEASVDEITEELLKVLSPIRKDNFQAARKILRNICGTCLKADNLRIELNGWLKRNYADASHSYDAYLYNETPTSVMNVKPVSPVYSESSPEVPGRQILRDNYDKLFTKYPLLVTFGEDTGHIGGVNQSLEGLQKKFGELRITDTGIREATILGQGIGLALRGMRPIAEIQYLDYLMYALQILSDDLATTHYRTAGRMVAPLIISTRGHRLEGMWHSGSPMSMLINSIRAVSYTHLTLPTIYSV